MGAEVIQIFGSSPRQWRVKLPSIEDVSLFKEARKKSGIKAVYLHAPYLNNLGSTDAHMVQKTVANLVAQLTICELIGGNGVVFHTGSGKDAKKKGEALKQAAQVMKEVLKKAPGVSQLIIENTAGGGARIGVTPEEIGTLLHTVKNPRVKVCYDTAHGFEAGLIKEHTPQAVRQLFNDFERAVGKGNLVAVHANDSKTEYGSHHDRHENIGKGYIGEEAFGVLGAEPLLAETHWMLEVPGFDGNGPDKQNLDILKKVVYGN